MAAAAEMRENTEGFPGKPGRHTEGLYALKSDAFMMGVPYSERLVPKEVVTYFSSDL